jgi:hypothetical protein
VTGAGAADGARVEQGAAPVSIWAGEAKRRPGLGTGGSTSDDGHLERQCAAAAVMGAGCPSCGEHGGGGLGQQEREVGDEFF